MNYLEQPINYYNEYLNLLGQERTPENIQRLDQIQRVAEQDRMYGTSDLDPYLNERADLSKDRALFQSIASNPGHIRAPDTHGSFNLDMGGRNLWEHIKDAGSGFLDIAEATAPVWGTAIGANALLAAYPALGASSGAAGAAGAGSASVAGAGAATSAGAGATTFPVALATPQAATSTLVGAPTLAGAGGTSVAGAGVLNALGDGAKVVGNWALDNPALVSLGTGLLATQDDPNPASRMPLSSQGQELADMAFGNIKARQPQINTFQNQAFDFASNLFANPPTRRNLP